MNNFNNLKMLELGEGSHNEIGERFNYDRDRNFERDRSFERCYGDRNYGERNYGDRSYDLDQDRESRDRESNSPYNVSEKDLSRNLERTYVQRLCFHV